MKSRQTIKWEAHIDATAEVIRQSETGRVAVEWQAAGEQAADRAEAFLSRTGEKLGTLWRATASLLGRTHDATSSEPETIEETS